MNVQNPEADSFAQINTQHCAVSEFVQKYPPQSRSGPGYSSKQLIEVSFLISVRNSCLSNNLVLKNLKFLLRFNFILNRLIFRTLSCITTSDSLLNSKPSSRQPLRKETLSAKPERVLNSHLAILNLLLRLLLNIY